MATKKAAKKVAKKAVKKAVKKAAPKKVAKKAPAKKVVKKVVKKAAPRRSPRRRTSASSSRSSRRSRSSRGAGSARPSAAPPRPSRYFSAGDEVQVVAVLEVAVDPRAPVGRHLRRDERLDPRRVGGAIRAITSRFLESRSIRRICAGSSS